MAVARSGQEKVLNRKNGNFDEYVETSVQINTQLKFVVILY